jgi:ferredoxin--NADP+ reductase
MDLSMPHLNAIVTQRIDSAPGLMILRVAPEGWELPPFTPGQFAVLGLPASAPKSPGAEPDDPPLPQDTFLSRAYSIASSSLERQYLEFYLVEVKTGALTPRLFALKEGDRVWLGPKFTGRFTLDQVPQDQNVVFIATGTGLAPYMSMLRTHLEAGGSRRYAVLHGARRSRDLGYREELLVMQGLAPNFLYIPVLTRPETEPVPWKGHTGRLPAFWKEKILERAWGFQPSPANTHCFLCGNPAMVEAMEAVLEAEGFTEHSTRKPGQVHSEKYW